MKKQDLFNLTVEVQKILNEPPIIVGSQAIFALTDKPPDIVLRSVECDFLLLKNIAELRPQITESLGIFSDYQEEKGYYADVLGKATVVLPNNWEKRLVAIRDKNENIIANCIEVHDLAISKLMAGREKDFEFLNNLFESNYLQIDTFIKRAILILEHPSANALNERLSKLIQTLETKKNLGEISKKIKQLSKSIK